MRRNFHFFFTSAFPPAVTPADAADDHAARFKFPHHAAGVGAGTASKTTIHFCYGTFVSFQGGRGAPTCSYIFSVLPHCMTVYFGKRRLAPETQSWQSTWCHFNEASWCHDNAAGHAALQDGQHGAAYLGKVGKEASAVCTISVLAGGSEATRNLRIRAEGSHLRLQERASNLSRCDGPLSSLGCFPGSHPMHAGKRSRICSSQNRNKWVRQYLGEWKIRRIVKVDSRIVLI